jgi:alkyl sulfatase BDS1-like metallo-beta-lactamase superfamily hydrolase
MVGFGAKAEAGNALTPRFTTATLKRYQTVSKDGLKSTARERTMRKLIAAGAGLIAAACASGQPAADAQSPNAQSPASQPPASAGLPAGMSQIDPTAGLKVQQIVPGLRWVEGRNVSSNTFVLDTSAGAVVIDTSRPPVSTNHFNLMKADGVTSAAYVILTHGHGDHTGGVALWKGAGAKVVAHESFEEFLAYQRMLGGFFSARNGAQFQFAGGAGAAAQTSPGARPGSDAVGVLSIKPDITFADRMTLDAGTTKLELIHTPGETPDHLTVWVPGIKAAFIGDNFYESFPNMYTLRGTRPRWPLEYIASLNTVLALEPELVLPSHGPPIVGAAEAKRQLTKMRDAIVYVHDAVVKGMNEGKDVHTLMQEVKLPPELNVGEGYGKISWSVRGIYEGYAGWFSGDPADMYEKGRESVSTNVVTLAGGPAKVAAEASNLLAAGKSIEALQLTTIGLEGAPGDRGLLTVRIAAFEALIKASTNRNELGWLQQGLAQAKKGLG